MASNPQFTEMFLEWPLSKMLVKFWSAHEHGSGEWGLLDYYEHKQIPKKSCLKVLVRFWNNLIEIFLEWPFSELFLKFWSVNKHGISEWGLLALYRLKEILVNSSLKATKKKNHKKSGEQSRAILTLLFYCFVYITCVSNVHIVHFTP